MDKLVETVDVAIVGAGISGLVAAYRLLEHNPKPKVVILEAKERIGGRLSSVNVQTANGSDDWDMGGQWVSDSQHVIMKLLLDFECKVYPQYMTGKHKLIAYNLTDIRTYSGLIPNLSVAELLDSNNIMNKIESMAKEIPIDDPLKCKFAKEWDSQTVSTYIEEQSTFAATKAVIFTAVRTIFGSEPSQMSLFYFLYYCALSGGLNALLDTEKGAAQESKVPGTIYRFAEKLHSAIGSDKVVLGDPVSIIDQSSDSSVLVKTDKGRVFSAKYVISSVPPHLLERIRFDPPRPYCHQQLCQRMPVGNLIKCLAVYKRPFWREKNFSGQAVMLCESYSKGPLSVAFDATTSNGTPALLGFISGEHALYWSQKTKEERRDVMIECFVALYGSEARTELVTYEDKDWSKEPYSGGCPVGIMQPGCLTYFEHALREPFGRVHWAGTETAHRWMGYIDGAAEAGERAAGEVAALLKSGHVAVEPTATSPIFDMKTSKSKGKARRLLRLALLGAVAGGAGYYLYKRYEKA